MDGAAVVDPPLLIRADHPSSTKSGGVRINYRNFLPLKLINIHSLNECITFEITLEDKNQSDPKMTLKTFVITTNPFLIVAIGDFNAKSSNWYTGDTTTFEGSKTEAITSQFGLKQIINEPTHIQ